MAEQITLHPAPIDRFYYSVVVRYDMGLICLLIALLVALIIKVIADMVG